MPSPEPSTPEPMTPEPGTPAGRAGLAAIAGDPGHALLAFDFDGVLSPIVDDPQSAQPLPGMFPALAEAGRRVGAVAIITGRPVSFLTSRTGFGVLSSIPAFTIYGQYGRERWDASSGDVTTAPASGDIEAVRAELAQLLARPGPAAGSWLEDKGIALAVHTRRTADPDGAIAALREPVAQLARRHRLHVEPGKLVLEIRPPGVHKGDVLKLFVADHDAAAVLYAGDDLGDLSAFAAVQELRGDGVAGITVCSGSAEADEVARAADLVVDGPAGIRALLAELSRRLA
jgi:trehalose 6-phosphate phosphatase